MRGVIGVPIWWRGRSSAHASSSAVTPPDLQPEDADLLELFAKHAAIAITNARLHEAAETNARAEAAAAERNRMAREVHDTVAKGLVSVLLHLRAASRPSTRDMTMPRRRPSREAREAGEVALGGDAAERARARPSPLEGRTLEEALSRELGVGQPHRHDRRAIGHRGGPSRTRPEVAHTLFRIAQEALTNAIRHAEATSVRVGFVYADDGVTLLVQDDGAGFDRADSAHPDEQGLGLEGMAERARLLGGTFELDSTRVGEPGSEPGSLCPPMTWGSSSRRLPRAGPGGRRP